METVGRGKARFSGVPLCKKFPLALYLQLTSGCMSLLSPGRQQRRQCMHCMAWLHQVAGLPSVGNALLVQVTLARVGAAKDAQGSSLSLQIC